MAMQRFVRILVLSSIALMIVGTWVWYDVAGPGAGEAPKYGIKVPAGIDIGGPFELTAHTGETVTLDSLSGRFALLYFGYTNCPDFCPTDLQKIAVVLNDLGDRASRVQPVFITIDPARDTPDRLAEYVPLFDDRILGLSGTAAQVDRAAKAFKVYYRKAETEAASDYLMDHSLYVYLLGPDGKLLALFDNKATAEDITAALNHYIDAPAS